MDNAALVGIVVGFPVKVVGEFLPRPVSGGGNGGLALAAGYDFDTAMIDCYGLFSFLRVVPAVSFVPRGTKRRLQDRTYHIHVVYKCALSEISDKAHYPRRKIIREVERKVRKIKVLSKNFSDYF